MALPNLKRNLDGIFETPKKATLVSPTGQRVAVPVDSPESKQYFSKGYKLETSSPVNPNAITSTGGGELPSGSVDTTQSNDQTNAYQSLLVDSLKQAQGVDTTELLQKRRDLQRKAIAARTDTAGTETMSPSQRSQIRQSNVGVIEGEIDENAYQLAKADKAIANFEDVFFKAQQFGQEFADKMAIPETMIESYKLAIEADPSNMSTLLSTLNDKSKQAVINSLDYTKLKPKPEEKDFQFIKGTEQQPSGTFDPSTGTFTPQETTVSSITGSIQPSGNMVQLNINGRDFNIDSVASSSLGSIDNALRTAGVQVNGQSGLMLGAVESSTFRTAEQQKALFDAGKSQLDGTNGISKHQLGLAIDVFPDQNYVNAITETMNKNGWFQTAEEMGDNVHFEFLGENANVPYDDNIEFGYNDKIITSRLPDLGGKAITDKSARTSNLPFGITSEQANWIMERRPGNIEFQRLKTKDYSTLISLFELKDDIAEIRKLKDDVNTGFGSKAFKEGLRFVGRETEKVDNFTQLQVKTGKELALFVKSLSGAAVSEEEAQRLAKLVPNVNQQDNQFVISLDDYEDDLSALIEGRIQQYDFFDEEDFRIAVTGVNSAVAEQQTVNLQDPKTGEVKLFENLSQEDLDDAINNGFVIIK